MKTKIKFIVKVALFLVLFRLAAIFCEKETAGFTVAGISSRLEYNPAWDARPLDENEGALVTQALKQPYTFLSSGGQCYVFLSEDGQYVLKFFKLYRRRLPDGIMALPLPSALEPLRQKQMARKAVKLYRDFGSYRLAFDRLQEDTGLLYVHLNRTKNLHKKVTIFDKLGIAHTLPLDEFSFVLQKRVTLAHSYIDALMEEHKIAEAKNAIHALVDIFVRRCQKGIFDEDAFISRNFGFAKEGKAIILDAGRLVEDRSRMQPAVYKQDLEKTFKRLTDWLLIHHKDLAPHVQQELSQVP